MEIKIVTDSTSDLDKDTAKNLSVEIVPLNVHFGDEVYKDGIEINSDDFFDKLINGTVFPKTSQPSVGEFIDVYEKLGNDGSDIISIHISDQLSGTINSARQAAKHLEGKIKVHIIDSKQISISLGLITISAATAVKEGKTLNEVLDLTESLIARSHVFTALDTLEYLEKGGRIGKAKSLVGKILNFKPIIGSADGIIDAFGRGRSNTACMIKLEELVKSTGEIESIGIVYSTDKSLADKFSEQITQNLKLEKPPKSYQIGPVIGVYGGPNVIGVGIISKNL
ncbi:MAG: fatty acid-binding protein DegV [Chloroflexi bacterium]|nr:MAG: DegV family protein [SAR202 cluster bacterium]MBR49741.1 fatty acid-binding protein DegV [Chloroflexota bacterium]|tara:strand:- start:144 stop:989 length:846 start_codon:yes stop_codon:yes gene_type:complete